MYYKMSEYYYYYKSQNIIIIRVDILTIYFFLYFLRISVFTK